MLEGNINKSLIFSLQTNCSALESPIVLKYNTWHLHIRPGHPEVADRLHEIKDTVVDPCYVAHSRPGPKNRHVGNFVLVNTRSVLGKSLMHVMIERNDEGSVVSTALFAKNYHGDIVWRRPEADKEPELKADYDRDADVLYLYLNRPLPAVSEPDEDGLLLRYSVDDARPCGVTVVAYQEEWGDLHDRLAERVASFLHVRPAEASRVLGLLSEQNA